MEMLVGDSPAADKEHKGAGSYAQGDQPSAFLLQGIAEEAGQGRSDTTHGPRSDSLEPVCGSTGLGTCSVHGSSGKECSGDRDGGAGSGSVTVSGATGLSPPLHSVDVPVAEDASGMLCVGAEPNMSSMHMQAEDRRMDPEGEDEDKPSRFSSEAEDDVLELGGVFDHEQAALLPNAAGHEDDCSDDSPPDLAQLPLVAAVAGFGEGASPMSDEDGTHEPSLDDYEDVEDEERAEDEEDRSLGAEDQLVGELMAEETALTFAQGWLEKLERLKTFKAVYGHPHVRQDEPLGAWVCVQRQKFRQGKMSRDREMMLRSLGFCFNAKEAMALRNKGCLLPSDSQQSCQSTPQKKDAVVSPALERQRRTSRETSILPWRVKREQEREKELLLRHGGQDVPSALETCDAKRPGVQPQCPVSMRGADRKEGSSYSESGKVPAARWVEAQARWDRKYQDLRAFRQAHGFNFETLPASTKASRNAELHNWTQNQRQFYKNGTLAPSRREKLNRIDFKWSAGKSEKAAAPSVSQACTAAAAAGPSRRVGRPRKDKDQEQTRGRGNASAPTVDRSARRGGGVWKEADCEKAVDLASNFMDGLMMHALSRHLSKKRGREGWLHDLRRALRSQDRKGLWHTQAPRVGQLLRSLETNVPWRTMSAVFEHVRAPLLRSIKEIKSAADVQVFLRTLTALTNVDMWRDGYRSYRLDVEDKVRPRAGWPTCEHDVGQAEQPRGVKRPLAMSVSGSGGERSLRKRPRVAGRSVGEWLRDDVEVSAEVAQGVLACLADEVWGVRTFKMMCALPDVEIEEMLAPLRDGEAVSRIIRGVHKERPGFFKHCAPMLALAACAPASAGASAGKIVFAPVTPPAPTATRCALASASIVPERADATRRLEEIRGKKMDADGTVCYLAHWEGSASEADTWEQAAALGRDEWMVSEWEAEQKALHKPDGAVRA